MPANGFFAVPDAKPEVRKAAAQTFLKTIGKTCGVTFSFSGSPKTDGKTVWLGSLDPATPDFETFALGHGIHEMMHVAYSELEKKKELRPLEHLFFNVLEDVRIDTLGEKLYGSYRNWRETLAKALIERGRLACMRSPDSHSASMLVALWLHAELMHTQGYTWAGQCVEGLRKSLVSRAGTFFCASLLSVAKDAAHFDSADDCVAAAKKLARFFEGQQNLAKTGTPSTRHCNTDPNAEGGSASPALSSKNSCGGASSDRDIPPSDLKRFLEEVCEEAETAAKTLETAAGFATTEETQPQDTTPVVGTWPDNLESVQLKADAREFTRAFENVKRSVAPLAEKFRDLLKANHDAGVAFADEGENLRDDWMNVYASGSKKLFCNRAPKKTLDAHVTVLLDRSGSMGISTMTKAKAAVCALCSALDKTTGLSIACGVFPGPAGEHVSVVKTVEDTLPKLLTRMPQISSYGSTPVAQAMHWAKDSCLATRGEEKLLLVITDGRFPPQVSLTAENDLKESGIELAILNIGIENRGAAQNSVTIDKPDEIAPGLLKLFSQTGLRQRIAGNRTLWNSS